MDKYCTDCTLARHKLEKIRDCMVEEIGRLAVMEKETVPRYKVFTDLEDYVRWINNAIEQTRG
jgi:hypothetical protein